MKSDVEIAREHVALPLEDIANRAGLCQKSFATTEKTKQR